MEGLYAGLLIFAGEVLSIYAEVKSAHLYTTENASFVPVFVSLVVAVTIGGWSLLAGYMLGLQAFKNIWIVSTASLASILVAEPILAYVVAHQVPTKGALIGFVLGVIGLVFATVR
jgi:hypothetical protein